MRSLFARSLAVLTASSYLLGVGDRHLDNFMMEQATGRVVGIDFGHAFGSATYILPVPELMGVRLTRQMTAFLRPLDSGVLLKSHMRLALAAIRERKGEVLRVMEVFLSEPLVDWEQNARKLTAEIDAENHASLRLAEALGFTREALLRAHETTHEGLRDVCLYGLLASDPRPA